VIRKLNNSTKGSNFLKPKLRNFIPAALAFALTIAPFPASRAGETSSPPAENGLDSLATSAAPGNNEGACATPPCDKKRAKLPSFKVVFHNTSGQTHLLVGSRTTDKEIENLIYYLAEVRKIKGLEKVGISPSGVGGYERGSILIFKEIRWARGEKLNNPRLKEKTYGHHVKAEYIWNSGNEIAYFGQKTLFSNNLSTP